MVFRVLVINPIFPFLEVFLVKITDYCVKNPTLSKGSVLVVKTDKTVFSRGDSWRVLEEKHGKSLFLVVFGVY